MLKIWLPPGLYRLLPVIYLLFGLLLITRFGRDTLGLISGVMLCAAAVLIWILRIHGEGGRRNSPDT